VSYHRGGWVRGKRKQRDGKGGGRGASAPSETKSNKREKKRSRRGSFTYNKGEEKEEGRRPLLDQKRSSRKGGRDHGTSGRLINRQGTTRKKKKRKRAGRLFDTEKWEEKKGRRKPTSSLPARKKKGPEDTMRLVGEREAADSISAPRLEKGGKRGAA